MLITSPTTDIKKSLKLLGLSLREIEWAPDPESLINQAFRKKAREAHPDKHRGNEEKEERFKKLNTARDRALHYLPPAVNDPLSQNPVFEQAVRDYQDKEVIKQLSQAVDPNLSVSYGAIGRRSFMRGFFGHKTKGPIIFLAIYNHTKTTDETNKSKMLSIVKSLAEKADLTKINSLYATPLTHAIALNNLDCVKLLLENGANPNHIVNDFTDHPLILAARSGFNAIVDEMLKHPSFNPHTSYKIDQKNTRTLLMLAAEEAPLPLSSTKEAELAQIGLLKLVENLLTKNVDVNTEDEKGNTALTLATKKNKKDIVGAIGGFLINQLQKAADDKNTNIKNVVLYVTAEAKIELEQLKKNAAKNEIKLKDFQNLMNLATNAVKDSSEKNITNLRKAINKNKPSLGKKILGALSLLVGIVLIGLGIAATPFSGGLSLTSICASGALLTSSATFFYLSKERSINRALSSLESTLQQKNIARP